MDPVVLPAIVAGASAVTAGVVTQTTQWWLDRSRRDGEQLEAARARIYDGRREAHVRMARKSQEILTTMMDPATDGRKAIGVPDPDWSWISAQVEPLLVEVMIFAGPTASGAAQNLSGALIMTGEGADGTVSDAQAAYGRYLSAIRDDLGVVALNPKGGWPQPALWEAAH